MNENQSIRRIRRNGHLFNYYMLTTFVVMFMIGMLVLIFVSFWDNDGSAPERFGLAVVATLSFLAFRKLLHLNLNTIRKLRAGDPNWSKEDWSNPSSRKE